MPIVTAHIVIQGQVQGVGFRKFIKGKADELGIYGTVQNQPDGDVKAVAVGEREKIEQLIAKIQGGNGYSVIKKVTVKWKDKGELTGEFKIVRTNFW